MPTAAAFWIIHAVSMEECSSLTQNLMHICCSTSLVILNAMATDMLTQWCLPAPLTSTVKSSLFIHVRFSSLSLDARLHQCCANHSCYIHNDSTFSRQTSRYTHVYLYTYTSLYTYACILTYTHICVYTYINYIYMITANIYWTYFWKLGYMLYTGLTVWVSLKYFKGRY